MPRETVFVIDTSGSMQGASMQQAKEALLYGLTTLASRDRFNIVEFNSITRPMWPDALPATAANVESARHWVTRLKADGGTEMAGALSFALNGRESPGVLRQVIFITDGAVGTRTRSSSSSRRSWAARASSPSASAPRPTGTSWRRPRSSAAAPSRTSRTAAR